ncbi:MAG: hypothetical protein ACREA4_03210 [Nitrososphaera sp.]
MSRQINESQSYQDKLVKLIPTEIVGAYMVLAGIVPQEYAKPGSLTISISLLILTPLYLWRFSNVNAKLQLLVTACSFVVWVYSLGGPFSAFGIHYPWLASILLILWTLTIPLFVGPDKVTDDAPTTTQPTITNPPEGPEQAGKP